MREGPGQYSCRHIAKVGRAEEESLPTDSKRSGIERYKPRFLIHERFESVGSSGFGRGLFGLVRFQNDWFRHVLCLSPARVGTRFVPGGWLPSGFDQARLSADAPGDFVCSIRGAIAGLNSIKGTTSDSGPWSDGVLEMVRNVKREA